MKKLSISRVFLLITTCLGAYGILYFLWPLGLPSGDSYFLSAKNRTLQEDEQGQWSYLRNLYSEMDASGDLFKGWDEGQQPFWKYAIAFAAYGLPSLTLIEPENKESTIYYLSVMINKMKSKKVWKEWQDFGFGQDPICKQNIMYKGHLNLMYGLYQLVSGRQDFAREFAYLTGLMVDELETIHAGKQYEGIACEPNRYFVHCNSVALMSLHIHDLIYQTNYMEDHGTRVISFMKERMTDPETGLYWKIYHPSHDSVEKYLSAYTNAWAMVMLRYFDPSYHEKLYQVWKKTFVHEVLNFAYVAETPTGGPSRLASLFGLWAAKEFHDQKLFVKLRNALDRFGGLAWEQEEDVYRYKRIDNTLANGMVLAFKVHIGWQELLDHPWDTPFTPAPSTEGMTWLDILTDEIYGEPKMGISKMRQDPSRS